MQSTMLTGASLNSVVPSTQGPGTSRDLGPTIQPGSLNARPLKQFHDLAGALFFAGIDDFYSEANFTGSVEAIDATAGDDVATGQSFTSNGGLLSSAQFHLAKNGSPTGTAVAKLYAATGTFGTDAKPTGAALATSGTLDVSTIPTFPQTLMTFTFSGANQYLMVAGTVYCIALE